MHPARRTSRETRRPTVVAHSQRDAVLMRRIRCALRSYPIALLPRLGRETPGHDREAGVEEGWRGARIRKAGAANAHGASAHTPFSNSGRDHEGKERPATDRGSRDQYRDRRTLMRAETGTRQTQGERMGIDVRGGRCNLLLRPPRSPGRGEVGGGGDQARMHAPPTPMPHEAAEPKRHAGLLVLFPHLQRAKARISSGAARTGARPLLSVCELHSRSRVGQSLADGLCSAACRATRDSARCAPDFPRYEVWLWPPRSQAPPQAPPGERPGRGDAC